MLASSILCFEWALPMAFQVFLLLWNLFRFRRPDCVLCIEDNVEGRWLNPSLSHWFRLKALWASTVSVGREAEASIDPPCVGGPAFVVRADSTGWPAVSPLDGVKSALAGSETICRYSDLFGGWIVSLHCWCDRSLSFFFASLVSYWDYKIR